MKFNGIEHKIFYNTNLAKLKFTNNNKIILYLLGISEITRNNFGKIYDMNNKKFIEDNFNYDWHTWETKNIVLWAYFLTGEKYEFENYKFISDSFLFSSYHEYYIEALKLARYGERNFNNYKGNIIIRKVDVSDDKYIGIYVKAEEILENIMVNRLLECIPENRNYIIYKDIGYDLLKLESLQQLKNDIKNGKIKDLYLNSIYDININKEKIKEFFKFSKDNQCIVHVLH